MIYIDYSNFRPSSKWKRDTKKKYKKLCQLFDAGKIDQLKLEIDRNQKHWTKLKDNIIKSTVNKCWFTEGSSDVFHFHIEHFRPKKRVDLLGSKYAYPEARHVQTDPGYWWLSINYRNFRIAGQITNSPKGNYFPLITGSPICSRRVDNYNNEQILLLDPTKIGDADLIKYDINSEPYPAFDIALNPLNFHRASASIEIYGLKEKLVSDARRRYLQQCNRLIKRAERYYAEWRNDKLNSVLKGHFADVCTDLKMMTDKNHPFSSMLKCRLLLIPDEWTTKYLIPFL